jgi:hypothetical protein
MSSDYHQQLRIVLDNCLPQIDFEAARVPFEKKAVKYQPSNGTDDSRAKDRTSHALLVVNRFLWAGNQAQKVSPILPHSVRLRFVCPPSSPVRTAPRAAVVRRTFRDTCLMWDNVTALSLSRRRSPGRRRFSTQMADLGDANGRDANGRFP